MIIKLKDGSIKEYDSPTSAAEITKDISMGLYRNACCVLVDGKVKDLRTVIDSDCSFEVLTFDDEDGKRHLTTPHLTLWLRQLKGFIQMPSLLSVLLLKTDFITILT